MRATARVTLSPLVESLPCLGAVTITLLEEPYIDLSLALIGGLDLMQLPGVRDGVLYAAQTVGAQGGFRIQGCTTKPVPFHGGRCEPSALS